MWNSYSGRTSTGITTGSLTMSGKNFVNKVMLAVCLTAPLFVLPDIVKATQGERGKELFRQHCAACHGSNGGGGVGVPLSLPSFIDTVDDDYLVKTIRHGRPGRVMPAFHHLDERELKALIAFIRQWTGVQPEPYSQERISGDPIKGKKIFQRQCAVCHGENGEGGKGTGVTFSRPRHLPILASALNNAGFLASASDHLIHTTITKGRKSTPMPSAETLNLSEQNVNDLVAYIRSWEMQLKPVRTKTSKEPAYLIKDSPYDLQTTIENVKNAVAGANLKLIRVQELDKGLVPKGQENKKQIIIYSCGFSFLYEALKVDPRVGLFLPCRITVVEHKGKVKIMAINTKHLATRFNNEELDRLCAQMYESYVDILDEATL
ncbi:MAG: hypothetical protein BMS9Abin36_0141 [Gammaproteobacteria bacterium]|nr:MAG: hypothetical protein BMS9Abin36_0141 [Gammaproteobacteria bacterium]